jgi:predicted dehydrogenase
MPAEPLLTAPLNIDGPFPDLSRPLRLAIVGGGGVARVHAWAARLSDRWQVRAVAPSADAARALAAAGNATWQGCQVFESHDALFDAVRAGRLAVDAVAVAVPNDIHYAVAAACLDAGVALMCEKPLTKTLVEARDLVDRATRAGVVASVAYPYGAYPMVRQARHLITSGQLGRVRQTHVEFVQDFLLTQTPAASGSWRHDPARAGAGSSADIGTHALHLIEFVTGLPIERLRAEFHVSGPARPIEDTFFAFVRAADDVCGTLWGSQAAAGVTSGPRFRVIGELGTVEWDNGSPQSLLCHWIDQPAQVFTRGRGRGLAPGAERLTRRPRGNVEGWVEAWANLYTEFALAVAARADGIEVPAGVLASPTMADGARGVQFVDAMVASAHADSAWMPLT